MSLEIENLLEKFKNVKVLVVGDVMLDRYWWGSVTRISPEAPVPVVKVEAETERCMVTETLTLPAALTILAEVEEVQRAAR